MSKQTSYGKIYCLDVRARPQLSRGRVFTVPADSKKCVRADAPLRPRERAHLPTLALPLALRGRAVASARTREQKFIKNNNNNNNNLVVACWKREEKNVWLSVFNPQDS
jgi:hypothetical protein